MAALCEALAAGVALEGLLTTVDEFVPLEVAPLSKPLYHKRDIGK